MAYYSIDGGGISRPKPKGGSTPKRSGSLGRGGKSIRRKATDYGQGSTPTIRSVVGPKSRELERAKKSLSRSSNAIDVYGSGGSGSGGGGGGSRRSSGSGGSRGYSNANSYYAKQLAWEKQRYAQEKREAEARRQRELNAARAEAKASLKSQLSLIDAAMKRAKQNYDADRTDWLGRQDAAKGEINSIYGQITGDTKQMNQAALANLGAGEDAAMDQAGSLINAIAGRNTETENQLGAALAAMGMDQALGTEQARASEALSLAEILAQGQQAQTQADYGLMQGTQEAIGNWNVTGLGTDKARGIQDVNAQVNAMLAELQRRLSDSRAQGEQDRLKARGEYDAFIKKLQKLSG